MARIRTLARPLAVAALAMTALLFVFGAVAPRAHAYMLDPSAAMIRRARRDLIACYERAQARGLEWEGRLEVRFRVNAEGRVVSVVLHARPELRDPSFRGCIRGVFFSMTFPAGEAYENRAPLIFARRGAN